MQKSYPSPNNMQTHHGKTSCASKKKFRKNYLTQRSSKRAEGVILLSAWTSSPRWAACRIWLGPATLWLHLCFPLLYFWNPKQTTRESIRKRERNQMVIKPKEGMWDSICAELQLSWVEAKGQEAPAGRVGEIRGGRISVAEDKGGRIQAERMGLRYWLPTQLVSVMCRSSVASIARCPRS
jgi:hypothetical protein